ncbi:MAG: EF-hand domain-containing protein [Cypionkella sp.]
MRLIPIVLACLLPLAAQASPLLPETLLKTIKADPTSYLDSVAGLIASYGGADGITEEQVAGSVALVRAKARVSAIVGLIGADLDGDGTVTREEITLTEAAASAAARRKLEKVFVAADVDGDATVSVEELSDFGAMAAMSAISPAQMAQTKVLMGFDADGDGKVTLNEVREGLAGLMS